MRCCKCCGTKVNIVDIFCSHCGKKLEPDVEQEKKHVMRDSHIDTDSSNNDSIVTIKKKPIEKLCCELAYFGPLFWLPLIFCAKTKYAKYYSNQGLWVLIISIASCWAKRILCMINELLSGSVVGIVYGGIYSMFFMLFIIFMLYLFINCLKAALRVHRDEVPESILFFEERAIIK